MEQNLRFIPATISTRDMHTDMPENDDEKYYIRVTATNDKVDMHNSIMDPKTTLRNFEQDAKVSPGVALKDHHAYRSFGYGRSENALLTDKNELMIDFFILKGMEYDGSSREFKSSDKLIRAIEHDLVNQVSVGFFGEREVCNLCKKDVRRWYWYDDDYGRRNEEYCQHKMGKKYETDNGKMERATYTVYDARLKEVSLVEFGSNRETAIEKKREMASFIGELMMTDQEWAAKIRETLGVSSIRSDDEPEEVVSKLEKEVGSLREQVDTYATEIETHKTKISELETSAKDGESFRASRIEEGIKQGVRAYGDEFDEEYHREYYKDLPMEKLDKAIENHQKIADANTASGRSTSEKHEPPPESLDGRLQRLKRRRGRR